MLLKNKIALVTGSTQNIARQGAKVVVHSRYEVDARKVAQEINGDFYTADVVDAAQVAAMFEHIKKTMAAWTF